MGALYAACGNGVWVANAETCDQRGGGFDRTIHVHHSQSPTPGRCRAWNGAGDAARDLFVRYVDGESFSTARDHNTDSPLSIARIAAFAKPDGRLLCHCAAGLCRGPTMAVLAKIARGCTPWQAMHDVAAAMWLGQQRSPQFFSLPLSEISRWYWDGAPLA